MCMTSISTEKTDAFGQRMMESLNGAAVALMMSVGHRTGLFDTLAELPPSDSHAIADAAGLNERYVREWLGAMVTAGVVEYDAGAGTYRLPPEHAACLTRAASPNNIAVVSQFIPVLASVEDDIVRCFHLGGGVPYAAYPRFHEVMAEESGQTIGAALLDSILPLAQHAHQALAEGIEVLDVGCGRGQSLNIMAEAFPNSRFTGYDVSEEAAAFGRAQARRKGLTNVRFEARDVARLDEPDRYGLITAFDAIHDQAQPRQVLKGIARSLAPDGTFLMQDIAGTSHVHEDIEHPMAPFLYTISCMHCMSVSLADGGEGLGAMWGKQRALELLTEAGFTKVQVTQLPHDEMNFYFVAHCA